MSKYRRMTDEQGIVTENDEDGTTASSSTPINTVSTKPTKRSNLQPRWRAYLTVGILAIINTLNYMDRFTIPSVLADVKNSYNLNEALSGLLQTVFICSYMVFAPLFGYLGDRYSRKWIIVVGMTVWSGVTLGSSFVPDSAFWLFLIARGLVGIGESSYITVSPSIVGDLFAGEERFTMLTIIYLTVPIGSGLGYVVGAQIAAAFGDWRYALRFTPLLALVSVALLVVFVRDPVRGSAERHEQARLASTHDQPMEDVDISTSIDAASANLERSASTTSYVSVGSLIAATNKSTWLADLKSILIVRTFLLNAAGFTAVCFVAGALSWWTPVYLAATFQLPTVHLVLPADSASVAFAFGLLTCFAGFVGVGSGLLAARVLRPRFGMVADPLSCAVGLLLAGPAVYMSIVLSPFNDLAVYAFTFLGEAFLCLSWAFNTDIMLRVIVPSRRNTANAMGMLASHLFGDALCPLLIGAIADQLVLNMCDSEGVVGCVDQSNVPLYIHSRSLMYALFMNCFVCALGGGAYLFCSLTLERDAKSKDEAVVAEQRRAEQIRRETLAAIAADGNPQQSAGSSVNS